MKELVDKTYKDEENNKFKECGLCGGTGEGWDGTGICDECGGSGEVYKERDQKQKS